MWVKDTGKQVYLGGFALEVRAARVHGFFREEPLTAARLLGRSMLPRHSTLPA